MTGDNGLLPQTPRLSPQTPVYPKTKFPFRTALSLHRENATLHPQTANVEEKHPQHDVGKKEGHHALME